MCGPVNARVLMCMCNDVFAYFSECKDWMDSNRYILAPIQLLNALLCLHAYVFNEIQTVLNVDGNRSASASLMEFTREMKKEI